MEIHCKKKFRVTADLCNTFGFSEHFFRKHGGYSAEAEYGLYLNLRRCQSIIGGQFFRAKFFLDKLGTFYMDDELADSLSPDDESKQITLELFSSMYKEALRWQMESQAR